MHELTSYWREVARNAVFINLKYIVLYKFTKYTA